jgi:hypothetical protein
VLFADCRKLEKTTGLATQFQQSKRYIDPSSWFMGDILQNVLRFDGLVWLSYFTFDLNERTDFFGKKMMYYRVLKSLQNVVLGSLHINVSFKHYCFFINTLLTKLTGPNVAGAVANFLVMKL